MLTQFHKMSANYFRHVKKNLKYCSVIPKNFFFGPLQDCFFFSFLFFLSMSQFVWKSVP